MWYIPLSLSFSGSTHHFSIFWKNGIASLLYASEWVELNAYNFTSTTLRLQGMVVLLLFQLNSSGHRSKCKLSSISTMFVRFWMLGVYKFGYLRWRNFWSLEIPGQAWRNSWFCSLWHGFGYVVLLTAQRLPVWTLVRFLLSIRS